MDFTISLIDSYINRKINEAKDKKSYSRKKISRDEYVSRLKISNPTVELIGDYINMNTKATHHCLIHDIYWEILPYSALKGTGCLKCRGERIKNKLNKKDDYLEFISSLPNIEVRGKYINMNTPIEHYCKIHDLTWMISPGNIKSGHRCPECGKEKYSSALRKTQKEYERDVLRVNSNIIVKGEYVNNMTPILHQCKIDGYEWNVSPSNILSGKGCPMCSNKVRITPQAYREKVALVNPNIEVCEDYINAKTQILHRCKIHNIFWKPFPFTVLNGGGCSECAKDKYIKNRKRTDEEYAQLVQEINPDIVFIGEYVNNNTPTLHKCLIDGHEWYTSPANILSGKGCPVCHETSGERKIRQWLEKHNIEYIFQKRFDGCRDVGMLPFDFYLPKFNKCIEYDDIQHYCSIDFFGGEDGFLLRRWHDNIKNQYCEDNNIPLLRIKHDSNIESELNNFLLV